MSLLVRGQRSLGVVAPTAAAAAGLHRCLWEVLAPQTRSNNAIQKPAPEGAGSPAAAATAAAAAACADSAAATDQRQQQPSLAFTQLLQQLQRLHVSPLGRVLTGPVRSQLWQQGRALHSRTGTAASAAVAPWPAAEQGPAGKPHQQQQQEHQQQHVPAGLPCLQPYQQAAIEAVTSQLGASQQRLLLQLPPSAEIAALISHLASHFAPSHSLLLLVSSSARAAALKASLTPLLNPGLNPAVLGSQGAGPRVVPGDMIKPQHRVLIADLQQLVNMPSAAVQLLGLQHAPQALAIHEDGAFCNPQDSLRQLQTSSSSGSSQSSAPQQQQQGKTPAEAAVAAQSLAEQLLRQLRFIPQAHTAADSNRLLVSISSRTWPQLLLPPQLHASSVSSSSNSRSDGSQGFGLPGFKLLYPEAVAAGLLKPAATVRIPIGTDVPLELVAAADAAASASLRLSSSSSSSSSSEASQQQQQQAVEQLGGLLLSDTARTRGVAAACKTLAGGGKVLVYACGQNHARELNLALHLQGISSLALHEAQSPEDQAAVLAEFENNTDRVLVASTSCAGMLAAQGFSCPVSCVVMGVPTLSPEVYAAAVAPGLLAGFSSQGSWDFGGGGNDSSSSSGSSSCLVVDFTDRLQAAGAAAAGVLPTAASGAAASSSSGQRRRRSRRTVQRQAAAMDTAAAAAAGSAGRESVRLSYTCWDLLGSSGCRLLPLPDSFTAALSAAAAAAQPRADSFASSSSSSRSEPAQQAVSQPAVTGDLIWNVCADGSWAIPIKRGRGRSMAGLRVLWLTKSKRGFVPQEEQGLGHLVPLPGTSGKAMPLQKARLLAEAWLKSVHPVEASMRETGLEWRDRPMSDSQVIFCERHGLVYDREWSRGTANNMIDKFVVEVLRRPIEPRTAYIVRNLGPFAPAGLVSRHSVATTYQHTGALLQQALLEGLLTFSNSTAAAAAAAADAAAVAADAGSSSSSAAGGKAGRGRRSKTAADVAAAAVPAAGTGSGSGSSAAVLGPRRALQLEVEAMWDAGLRPKFTWMVLCEGRELLLDLMSGNYLWLSRVQQQQQQQGDAAAEGGVSAAATAAAAAAAADRLAEATLSGPTLSDSSSSNSSKDDSSSSSSGSAAGSFDLDASALYAVSLELPDGTRHPVATAEAALQLVQQFEQQQQQGTLPVTGCEAAPAGVSSSSSRGRGPLPVPLPAALERAEAVAAGLARSHAAFLSRAHVVRLCSMVGGWRVPAKTSEAHPCMPANHRQLEQLREAGLSVSRRFTGYDAHREWLRHQKTLRLPEQRASQSQLARIRELQLPLTDAAAATLTSAQAKGILFRAQLAVEAAAPSTRKQMEGERLRAKQMAWKQLPTTPRQIP